MLKNIVFGLLFIGLGIYFFLTPDKVWQRNEAWKSSGAKEPTDAYLIFVKIAGVILALTGVVVLVFAFFV